MKENFGGYEYNFETNKFIRDVNSAITYRKGLVSPKSYVVVLRDPITRWLSGLAQCFYGDNPTHWKNIRYDKIFEQVVFDEHTAPQSLFLKGIESEITTWFYCDDNLVDNVKHWVHKKFGTDVKSLDFNIDNVYNVSKSGPEHPQYKITQQQIIDSMKKVLDDNPKYVERLRSFYASDYELISKVNFQCQALRP